MPATGAALIADHVAPDRRAGALATIGAASGAGMVIGPAVAGLLAPHGLALSLALVMPLPALAFLVLWRTLPRSPPQARPRAAPLRLFDRRLRRPMAIAFASMFSVAVAQITVGFYALDRLGLDPEAAARTAGIALGWPPNRLIGIGGMVAALGFACAALATTPPALWVSNFVAAAGMGWVWPAFGTLAANAVEPHEQGAAAGTIGPAQGLGIILGPLAGSAIYALHIAAPYGCVALLLLIVALWRTTPQPLAQPGPL